MERGKISLSGILAWNKSVFNVFNNNRYSNQFTCSKYVDNYSFDIPFSFTFFFRSIIFLSLAFDKHTRIRAHTHTHAQSFSATSPLLCLAFDYYLIKPHLLCLFVAYPFKSSK